MSEIDPLPKQCAICGHDTETAPDGRDYCPECETVGVPIDPAPPPEATADGGERARLWNLYRRYPDEPLWYDLLKRLYNALIRPRVPHKLGAYQHDPPIPAWGPKLFDRTDRKEVNKEPIHESLREHVHAGNHVINIGGGIGISTIRAAMEVGPEGHVDCYEGAKSMCELIERNTRLNEVEEWVDVHHRLVGPANDVYGPDVGTPVHPANLPPCDVLVMDCEGAEAEIIPRYRDGARVVIVEAHPEYESDRHYLRELLEGEGYRVERLAQNPHYETTSHWVLTAVREVRE